MSVQAVGMLQEQGYATAGPEPSSVDTLLHPRVLKALPTKSLAKACAHLPSLGAASWQGTKVPSQTGGKELGEAPSAPSPPARLPLDQHHQAVPCSTSSPSPDALRRGPWGPWRAAGTGTAAGIGASLPATSSLIQPSPLRQLRHSSGTHLGWLGGPKPSLAPTAASSSHRAGRRVGRRASAGLARLGEPRHREPLPWSAAPRTANTRRVLPPLPSKTSSQI